MRISLLSLLMAIVVGMLCLTARAQDDAAVVAQIAARRELTQAKNNLRYFWQVDYPRQRRELDAAIEITELELENLECQLRQFRPFTRFSIGEPFPVTVRNLRICIADAELRLDNLRAERNALTRFHSTDFDALAAEVHAARMRVVAADADADSTAALPEPPGNSSR